MKRKNENIPGFDEIIFKDRNKKYGAYRLRKSYNTTLGVSLLGTVALAVVLVVLPALSAPKESAPATKVVTYTLPDADLIKALTVEPPVEKPMPAEVITRNTFVPPEIVSDTSQITNTMMSIDELNDQTKDGEATEIPPDFYEGDPEIPFEPEPKLLVQEMPEFPGGEEELLKFLSDNVIYPEEALENRVEGRITVRFVVSVNGSVQKAEVYGSTGTALDLSLLENEALRVIRMLPTWRPGKQDGTPVPVYFTVPVNFKIN